MSCYHVRRCLILELQEWKRNKAADKRMCCVLDRVWYGMVYCAISSTNVVFGLVWYMVWYMVWYGIWYGMVYGMVWFGMVPYEVVLSSSTSHTFSGSIGMTTMSPSLGL
jgi:hypothetical protein